MFKKYIKFFQYGGYIFKNKLSLYVKKQEQNKKGSASICSFLLSSCIPVCEYCFMNKIYPVDN